MLNDDHATKAWDIPEVIDVGFVNPALGLKALWLHRSGAMLCPAVYVATWTTTVEQLRNAVPDYVYAEAMIHDEQQVVCCRMVDDAPCWYWLQLQHGEVRMHLAGSTVEALQHVAALAQQWLGESTDDARILPMTFWVYKPESGPVAFQRRITVPTWNDIQGNYPETVQRTLAPLITTWRPTASGKFLLWRGVAGTGKTYAIRALAQAWRTWAKFDYIVDPEVCFGAQSDYLVHLLLQAPEETDGAPSLPEATQAVPTQWHVLVLEDMGDLIAIDARTRIGQGLSRLLNLVDGMLGQGLNLLVLLTTNEELGTVHPAIRRSGRCVVDLEFCAFTEAQAAIWLHAHGADVHKPKYTQGRTLAALYEALTEEHTGNLLLSTQRAVAGFHR